MRKDVYLHDPLTCKARGYTTTDWVHLTGTAVLCRMHKAPPNQTIAHQGIGCLHSETELQRKLDLA